MELICQSPAILPYIARSLATKWNNPTRRKHASLGQVDGGHGVFSAEILPVLDGVASRVVETVRAISQVVVNQLEEGIREQRGKALGEEAAFHAHVERVVI